MRALFGLYIVVFDLTILFGCYKAVFKMDRSPWWFLLALFIMLINSGFLLNFQRSSENA